MALGGNGSRYLKEPFDYAHVQRVEATEKIMAMQFAAVEKRLDRITVLVENLEKRLWMTIYGVAAVILTEAIQGLLSMKPD